MKSLLTTTGLICVELIILTVLVSLTLDALKTVQFYLVWYGNYPPEAKQLYWSHYHG